MSKKHLIFSYLAISLSILLPLNSLAYAKAVDQEKAERYTPSQVYDALNTKNSVFLEKITIQPSLDITVPKVDMTKIHSNQPLTENLIEDLIHHGYSKNEASQMNFGDYQGISNTWFLSKEVIEAAKALYPDLKNENLDNWTMGELQNYSMAKDKENNVYGMTPELTEKFAQRNITLDDARILLKDYYSYENILAQSDKDIKETLEGYYQFNLNQIKLQSSSISPAYLDPSIYYYVYFPGYGWDNFHKDSNSQNSSIAYAQAQRVQAIYNKLYQRSGQAFICQNLYGTYSTSQQGAHEGIDFSPSGNPSIYAVLSGTRIGGQQAGHLCVRTSTYSSYSYLHMNSISPAVGSYVADSSYVGVQGSVGNSTGPHVHFEVQDGSNHLSYESDNILESYSPYIIF